MNPFFLAALIGGSILAGFLIGMDWKPKRKEGDEINALAHRLFDLGIDVAFLKESLEAFRHDAAHDAKLLRLLLENLGLEHQIQPQQETLVKKSKERPA